MKRILLISLILLISVSIADANWRSKVREAGKLYEEGNYEESLVKYLEALDQEGDTTVIAFGLGNVLQAAEKFEDAGKSFKASLMNPDSTIRADALYNLGNALFGEQKYKEAAEAYKMALHLKPRQRDYLHNIELAEYLLQNQEEQQQQQQEQKQDNQNQDEEQEEQQDQQNQDQQQDQQQNEEQQQQEEEDQQQQRQQEQQEQEEQEQQQQQAQADTTLSKEDAERLLNALQMDEQQVLENIQKQQPTEGSTGKDW
ncbi:tetratricopeptide repeat protein [bacterium]|nr:tetratricopeptide repeat protein [bacterium]MBU1652738.1 tetratricopeptide repeat protein [bacterium]MBU1882490.1 tetratricopeptide repeat protein [bacterium]